MGSSRGSNMRVCFLVLAGLALVGAEKKVAVIDLCEDVDQSKCTVPEVRIDPCKGAVCLFKKGANATLDFDFVPNFSATSLKTGVYWPQQGIDVPFAGFGSDDACLYTTCPTVPGTQQFYSYTLYIGKKLPSGQYKIKWKVWNADNKMDQSQCTVYSVIVDPCPQGPAFCSMKKDKKYSMTLNLQPKFSASKLKLSIMGDVKNDGTFSTMIQPAIDGCWYLSCPLQALERRIFDVDLVLDKKASGKFPVKVKMWNEEDESQACCFTFNVKVK